MIALFFFLRDIAYLAGLSIFVRNIPDFQFCWSLTRFVKAALDVVKARVEYARAAKYPRSNEL